MKETQRLSDADLLKLSRDALAGRGIVTFVKHADKELANDRFDRNDARNAIKRGRVVRREPDLDGYERITIEGPSVDNARQSLRVVCKIRSAEPPDVVVLTAFKVKI